MLAAAPLLGEFGWISAAPRRRFLLSFLQADFRRISADSALRPPFSLEFWVGGVQNGGYVQVYRKRTENVQKTYRPGLFFEGGGPKTRDCYLRLPASRSVRKTQCWGCRHHASPKISAAALRAASIFRVLQDIRVTHAVNGSAEPSSSCAPATRIITEVVFGTIAPKLFVFRFSAGFEG